MYVSCLSHTTHHFCRCISSMSQFTSSTVCVSYCFNTEKLMIAGLRLAMKKIVREKTTVYFVQWGEF